MAIAEKDKLNDTFFVRVETRVMNAYRKLPREKKRELAEQIRKLLSKSTQ